MVLDGETTGSILELETKSQAPVLACPDLEQPYVLQTNASDEGLGVTLT